MKLYRDRAYITVNLDHILHNLRAAAEKMSGSAGIIPVIKADGYGHGAVPIARLLEPESNVCGFAVATLEEALDLRAAGIRKDILVLGYIFAQHFEEALQQDISFTIFTCEAAEALSEAALRLHKKAKVHIKVDTGMNRIGIHPCVETIALVQDIAAMDGLEMAGIFTHFPNADTADKTDTMEKLQEFQDFIRLLHVGGVDFGLHHYANSACILDLPCTDCEAVRLGISLYGLYPSDAVDRDALDLKPALSLYASVIHVKEIEAGESVGYGSVFTAEHPTKIATVSIGYGDGYPRSLSEGGYVLIHGKKARICGRVCMDLMMVDVTDIDDVKCGDTVTLIGYSEDAYLSVDTLAEISHRFSYEFVCDLGKRIPRVYIKNGKEI